MSETKATPVKKTRKPRQSKKLNYDQVLQHASALLLQEKTELIQELKKQASSEAKELQAKAETALSLTNGI